MKIPLLFMTYANPIFAYGTERFMQKCREAVSTALSSPTPFEEKRTNFSGFCDAYGIDPISMAAPHFGKPCRSITRARRRGFILCILSGGDGVRNSIDSSIEAIIQEAKRVSDVPLRRRLSASPRRSRRPRRQRRRTASSQAAPL